MNGVERNSVHEQPLISLGALECASSCVMTALAAYGLDPSHFLLRYWAVFYVKERLMTCKEALTYEMADMFGIHFHAVEYDRPEDMAPSLDRGHWVMLRCWASKLPFFPPRLLGEEDAGFEHYLLLTGRDSSCEYYRAVDPIAGHVGWVSSEVVREASVYRDKLSAYAINRPYEDFVPPSGLELLRMGSATNYQYMVTNPVGGLAAFKEFAAAVETALQWERPRLDQWLQANILVVSTTIRTRRAIWESYAKLKVPSGDEWAAYEGLAKEIVSEWVRLNYLLVKCKTSRSAVGEEPFRRTLGRLHELEQTFICGLYDIGRLARDRVG